LSLLDLGARKLRSCFHIDAGLCGIYGALRSVQTVADIGVRQTPVSGVG
jgi:hypothetical protein